MKPKAGRVKLVFEGKEYKVRKVKLSFDGVDTVALGLLNGEGLELSLSERGLNNFSKWLRSLGSIPKFSFGEPWIISEGPILIVLYAFRDKHGVRVGTYHKDYGVASLWPTDWQIVDLAQAIEGEVPTEIYFSQVKLRGGSTNG